MRRENFELMMAMTIGGIAFQPFEQFYAPKVTTRAKLSNLCADFAYVVARMSMMVPAICLR